MKRTFCIATLIWFGVIGAGLLPQQAAAYVPFKATYNGLFCETNSSWFQSAGTITISTTAKGKYSGKLRIGPSSYSFSGYLYPDGYGERTILRWYDTAVTVSFQVNAADSDLIEGTVSTSDWVANFYADRAVFNGKDAVSSDAGQFTLLIPGNPNYSYRPGGNGYGLVTVTKSGQVRMSGSLADGTKISQSYYISKNGDWPLFQSLYSGNGALYGWMAFNGTPTNSLSGELTWIRPKMPWTFYYPEGFAITFTAWGSHYYRPAKLTPVLNLPSALVEFNGQNLSCGFTNQISIDNRNHVVNYSANRLSMSFSTSSGYFSGKVMDPYTWQWRSFKGVVLQDYNCAGGYFLDWYQSGEVWMEEPQTQTVESDLAGHNANE